MRKVHETPIINGKQAKVYYNSDWSEYVVRFYSSGKHMDASDSHHGMDKQDAISTADYVMQQEVALITPKPEMSDAAKQFAMHHFLHGLMRHSWTSGLSDVAASGLDKEDFEALLKAIVKMRLALSRMKITTDNIHWSKNVGNICMALNSAAVSMDAQINPAPTCLDNVITNELPDGE